MTLIYTACTSECHLITKPSLQDMDGMSTVHGDGAAWEELSESSHGSEERFEENTPEREYVTQQIKHMPVETMMGVLTDITVSLSDQHRQTLSRIVGGTINMEDATGIAEGGRGAPDVRRSLFGADKPGHKDDVIEGKGNARRRVSGE